MAKNDWRMRTVLPSIAACRKEIELLRQKGMLEGTELVLRGEECPGVDRRQTEPQGMRGHRIALLKNRTLTCLDCGKRFRTGRPRLSIWDRAVDEALDPRRPFGRPIVL